jgi:site-specific recombinase XerD
LDPEELAAAAERFVAAMHAKGNAPRWIARRAACMRSFGKFLKKRKILLVNPFDGIETPDIPERLPKFALADEAKQIVDACADLRERLIVTLLIRCGLRLSELRNMRVEDVRRGPRQLSVIGKGNKEDLIDVTGETLALIEEWVAQLRNRQGYLLPGRRRGEPLSLSAIRAVVYRVTTRAGRRLNPHALRHSTATIHLEQGTDLRTIQTLMRHKNISTTQLYLHVVDKQKRKAVEDFPV